MKLSPTHLLSLFTLYICTQRADARFAPLVRAGTAEMGQGRFGSFARITPKGRKVIDAMTTEERTALDCQRHLEMIEPDSHSDMMSDSRGSRAAVLRAPGNTGELSVQEATPVGLASPTSPPSLGRAPRPHRRAGAKQAVGVAAPVSAPSPPAEPLKVGAPSTSTSASQGRTTSRPTSAANTKLSERSIAAPTSTAGNVTAKPAASRALPIPNAVRVQVGSSVTYYPLSSFEALKHGTKARVRTGNKPFKQYSVEASAGDVVVP